MARLVQDVLGDCSSPGAHMADSLPWRKQKGHLFKTRADGKPFPNHARDPFIQYTASFQMGNCYRAVQLKGELGREAHGGRGRP